jgi:predicted small metal-binding protein
MTMTVSIRCADFNNDCPAQFTTPDEPELLQHVELHTKTVHQPMEWTPELAEVVKTHIKQQ